MNITDGQWQIIVGIIAIVVAIALGVRTVRRKTHAQKQRSSGSSTAIQSGRDTNIVQ